MSDVHERIEALRGVMRERGIQAYIVCTEDFHGSEYVGSYFKARAYLSGFTGSAGTLLVLENEAELWTDGRYFLQAGEQLSGSGITLMKSNEKGVPTLEKFLADKLPDGSTVGFDGRTVSSDMMKSLEKELGGKNVSFAVDEDLADLVWKNRPPLSAQPVWELDIKYAGETRSDKLARVRGKMAELSADSFVISALDEIAWLLNLRGGDVAYNPVFLAYMIIGKDKVSLFADGRIFNAELTDKLAADGVEILPYNDFYKALTLLPEGSSVLLDPARVNCLIMRSLPAGIKKIERESPIILMKAVKNSTEQENIRAAHIKDGVAVTRFMYWLKHSVGKEKITEISAAEKLDEFRKEQENYLGQSFDPIVGYGKHGAIVHYSATEETNAELEPRGLLLSDTGGHYLEGTTDITRTYVLGEPTAEEKKAFTLVLAGYLELGAAVFPQGARGANLDVLAREPLWQHELDYNHGTGHGVGYLLNVHEGPHRINWRIYDGKVTSVVFEAGMVSSNEPGLYVAGSFGIRHESLVLCRERGNGFLCFDTLTMVPFDLDGIDTSYLTDRQVELLNAYHSRVYKEISPFLHGDELEWLKNATRAIAK